MQKAQVTVFMILGILIVAIFLFVIQMNVKVVTSQLESGQQEIFSKLLRKEAMRIFVEDCLRDELESALRLVGQSGRIWDVDGGSGNFIQGVTGTVHDDQQVYFGLQKEDNEFYPCDGKCPYTYPDTIVNFGDLIFELEDQIEGDLAKYLKAEATACVTNYIEDETGRGLELEFDSNEIITEVALERDGIEVTAFYPISFQVGGDNFFHLATFDFFYPSNFQRFLRAAVTTPLRWDWKFVDFKMDESVLSQPSFMYSRTTAGSGCTEEDGFFKCPRDFSGDYQSLDISLGVQETALGDKIFTFSSPFPNILDQPNDYIFKIARQNRAPALDYVDPNRACGEFDYLVVEGSDNLNTIEFTLHAQDPDEDVDGEEELCYTLTTVEGNPPAVNGESCPDFGELSVSVTEEGDIAALRDFTLLAHVEDKHGAVDEQLIKVKKESIIDDDDERSLFSLEYPWGVSTDNVISKEDPFMVSVNLPAETSAIPKSTTITFTANIPTSNFIVENVEDCVSFPGSAGCDLASYSTAVDVMAGSNHEKVLTGGTFTADFSLDYCGIEGSEARQQEEITVTVQDCYPHDNPAHPWPEPNHKKTYGLNEDGTTNLADPLGEEDINPYSATHACCLAGVIATEDDDTTCFEEVGCYETGNNVVLKKRVQKCGGDNARGNYCGGLVAIEERDEGDICGVTGELGCTGDILAPCEGQEPYSEVTDPTLGLGMCYGTWGCEAFCQQIVLNPTSNAPTCGSGCPIGDSCIDYTGNSNSPCVGGFCR